MSDFFAMGGYAFYVWSSWIIGVAILAGITWHSLNRAKLVQMELEILENQGSNPERQQNA